MKNPICKGTIIFLLLFFMASPSHSLNKRTFTVGVQSFEEYLPYSEFKDKKYAGFNRELLDLFATSKGYTFVYKARSINRLYKDFLEGDVDLKYPDNPYWSADLKKGKRIKYSDPIVTYIDGVMVIPENKGKKVGDLKRLGVVRGFTPFNYLKWIEAGSIEIHENSSYEGLLKQTIFKRVDGAYSNIAVSRYYLEKIIRNADALVFDPGLPYTKSHRHLSSFKHPELIDEFNDFLKENRAAVEALKKRYGVEDGM